MAEKIYKIKVVPNSKLNQISEQADGLLKIRLTAPAIEGRANKALLDILSKKYKIAKSKIVIISGLKSKNKTIKLLT